MKDRDFLSVESWSPAEVEHLLDLAARVKRGDVRGGLERRVMALLFLDPSLRTRASFETALFLHGGHAVVLEPGRGSWSLETAPGAVMDGTNVEHIADAARALGRYADILGVRAFPRGATWAEAREDRVLHDLARYCDKPVVNLESARRHPCQELADALTLREKLGETRGRRFTLLWAWHPKPLPTAVPASAALAAARLGMEITIARPPGYDLDPDDLAAIRAQAERTGGGVHVTEDLETAIAASDAVYVKSWGALELFGRPEEESAWRAPQRHWRLTAERLRTAAPQAIALHCLPVRRNVEIDDAVLDGPQSAVVDQAENRLHVQRALLLALAGAAC